MTKSKKAKSGQNGNSQPSFNPVNSWDIGVAIRDTYDTMERAMLPALLLGEAAYQIKKEGKDGLGNTVVVDHLEWGFPKKHLTAEIVSLFKTWGFNQEPTGYSYSVGGVPVKVTVYEGKYPYLENPDMVFYGPDEFKIPNQIDTYWKERNLIK